ncbi:MAG TPA: LysR family transcriptional regulator [Xanthobacteraceae bacterium]|nr:LysR family transcriptional regulator [Xanthobacteraceae bacterium]
MARVDQFSGLAEFLAVAQHASFRAAGAELRVTPSAVSQAVRALETRLHMPLFARTTRNVALTEAGAALLARLSPAAAEIGSALESLGALRERPTGTLRLSVPRIAVDLAMLRVLPAYREACPDVTVEIDVNDTSIDLATMQFDAGIRIGADIERDMIAARITPDFRWVVVGSPAYFVEHGKPKSPRDLARHQCIRYRYPTARAVHRWGFRQRARSYSLDPPARIIVNDHLTMIACAKLGLGVAYTADLVAAPALASGELEEVLAPHLPTTPGLFLYFPARSQTQPKLRAFIDLARRILLDAAPPASVRRRRPR